MVVKITVLRVVNTNRYTLPETDSKHDPHFRIVLLEKGRSMISDPIAPLQREQPRLTLETPSLHSLFLQDTVSRLYPGDWQA